jgi:hypothetical protein
VIDSTRANLNHESVLANHGLTIQRGRSHSRHSRASGKFVVNENGLARVCISKAVSLVGCGDARVRDRGHVDGHSVSERDEMDH